MDGKRPTVPVPSLVDDEVPAEETALRTFADAPDNRRPFLVFVSQMRPPLLVDAPEVVIGRANDAGVQLDDPSVSRAHAILRRSEHGTFVLEDQGSANGTFVNGNRISSPTVVRDGDRIQFGVIVAKLALQDALDEEHQRALYTAAGLKFPTTEAPTSTRRQAPWTPDSWSEKPLAQAVEYPDSAKLANAVGRLSGLPPLVTSWEIEELKALLAEAQQGKRFLLQGGDCAESLDECAPARIVAKLKILIQMSIVLIRGTRRPIIRVGRFAGQYAKPRSSPTEKKNGVELPSYFGDLVNGPEFTREARTPDPERLVTSYLHAAVTLNFVRALSAGGFADLRRPEYFDLSYFARADLPPDLSQDYRRICREITDSLNFVRSFGDASADDLMRVSFYTSHEGLNLPYEHAQTRKVPRREGFYDLTTHLPWIGERTRALTGAHIEFFRGIANPIAVKIGPKVAPNEVVDLCKVLNPRNEPGKLLLVSRLGVANATSALPPIIRAVERTRRRVLWVCDPMHGNATTTRAGIKTRNFDDILSEVQQTIEVHRSCGTYFGGVHFELTGDDVTECIGAGLSEEDLSRQYETRCDPRLNYRQALQMAFLVAEKLGSVPTRSSIPPPPR